MTKSIEYKIFRVAYIVGLVFTFVTTPAHAASVYMDELTSPEIRAYIQANYTTVIVPTGGTEQNGPHMVTGKHNLIVHYTAGEIAKKLGNALVAPVIAYVPEGNIEPPQGHMQFAGTLSVREETFAALLEDTAASLKQHGFKLICFVGDSGGNQKVQRDVVEKLKVAWAGSGVRLLNVSDYYDNNGQDAWIKSAKIDVKDPGAHAGFSDTSEVMFVDANAVRANLIGKRTAEDFIKLGSSGDSSLASAEYGRYLLKLKIAIAANQIRQYENSR